MADGAIVTIEPLAIDLYAEDGDVDLQKIADAGPPWSMVILKATQGTYYDGGAWFQRYWPTVLRVGGDRYGKDWFRGCYHYLDFVQTAKQQADFFLRTIDRAGGWSFGDIGPIVDVERGGQKGGLSAANVIDVTSGFARIVHEATGLPVILYGGELIRALGITDRMRCSYLWVARYSATLPPATYEGMGWTAAELLFWQYGGKVTATHVDSFLAGYPSSTPAGLADISVLTLPGGIEAMRDAFCVRPA